MTLTLAGATVLTGTLELNGAETIDNLGTFTAAPPGTSKASAAA